MHPIIYFYSKKGNFKISAFYGVLRFVRKLEKTNGFNKFTKIRGEFEKFIYNYDYVIDQIVRSLRTSKKSVPVLQELYMDIMNFLYDDNDTKKILEKIIHSGKYPKFLLDQELGGSANMEFSSNRKSEVFINQAFLSANKCPICGGLLHLNSISIDHVVRKQDGGVGNAENGQATHFYCNTTYKN